MISTELPPRVSLAHEQARDELRRADAKATTLLSLVGAVLAGVVALTTRSVSVAAMVALWVAAAPIGASVLVLLGAIRPRLSTPTPGTWLYAAQHGPASLLAEQHRAAEVFAADVCVLGRIAVAKHRRIARAVWLLIAGLAVLGVALVLAVIT